MTQECNYKDGKQERIKWYYENGQLEAKGNFRDGKQVGLWVSYYENGQARSTGNYKDGKPDGLWETYYENGRLSLKQNYKDGNLNFLEYFNEDGSLKKKLRLGKMV